MDRPSAPYINDAGAVAKDNHPRTSRCLPTPSATHASAQQLPERFGSRMASSARLSSTSVSSRCAAERPLSPRAHPRFQCQRPPPSGPGSFAETSARSCNFSHSSDAERQRWTLLHRHRTSNGTPEWQARSNNFSWFLNVVLRIRWHTSDCMRMSHNAEK